MGGILPWISLLIDFADKGGIAAVVDSYHHIKSTTGVDPTPDQVRARMIGVEKPEEYPASGPGTE
jgi:hypothetical protein